MLRDQQILSLGTTNARVSIQTAPGRTGTLPNTRAILVSLVAATVMIGSYIVVSGSPETQRATIVVAGQDIAPGDQLNANNLTTIQVDADSSLRDRAYEAPSTLDQQAMSNEWIKKGDVIHRDDVEPIRERGQVRVALPIERAWALGDGLSAGDRVDVYVTDDALVDATTAVVARSVLVIQVTDADATGFTDAAQVTMLAPDEDAALAIIDAGRAGLITLTESSSNSNSRAQPSTDEQP
jgi:hypothetical protein